jgi:hypothetical protein
MYLCADRHSKTLFFFLGLRIVGARNPSAAKAATGRPDDDRRDWRGAQRFRTTAYRARSARASDWCGARGIGSVDGHVERLCCCYRVWLDQCARWFDNFRHTIVVPQILDLRSADDDSNFFRRFKK